MISRDTLLRAICKDLDEDGPRLAFADWLDRQGDSSLAEFIRVQIQLAQVPAASRPEHPLAQREAELFRHSKTWQNVIGHDFQAIINFQLEHFQRGFHHVWVGEVPHFARLPKDSTCYGPIDHTMIGVRSAESSQLKYAERAAAKPLVSRLRTVSLLGLHLDERWVKTFVERSPTSSWRRLELSSNALSDDMCRWLADSRLARGECEVFIESNRIRHAGRQVLREAIGNRLVSRRKN